MIGAVHLALMAMVMKVSSTMVRGWSVFGLSAGKGERGDDRSVRPAYATASFAPAAAAAAPGAVLAAGTSPAPARDIRVTSAMPAPANDSGPQGGTTRETRVVTGAAPAAASAQADSATPSRARGIGSRFKSAPVRSTEKF
jgi:type IV secretion system protein VirB6